jgi:hypothetical protein
MPTRPKVSLKVLPKRADNLLFIVSDEGKTSAVVSYLTLRNKSKTDQLIYKVKTNCPERYWVELKSGVLQSGQSTQVRVELRPEYVQNLLCENNSTTLQNEMESNDKFLIQCVSIFESEVAQLKSKVYTEEVIFERAAAAEILNTKRNVKVDVIISQNEAIMTCIDDTEDEVERKENEKQSETNEESTASTKILEAAELISIATSKIPANFGLTTTTTSNTGDINNNISATSALEEVAKARNAAKAAEVTNEDLKHKMNILQIKLTQTEQQLKQSVEQHRTARKSLDALRKASQATEARHKLISRSTGSKNNEQSKGPPAEFLERDSDYWCKLEEKGHPNILRLYPLSYLPGPASYFVLVWFVVMFLSYILL